MALAMVKPNKIDDRRGACNWPLQHEKRLLNEPFERPWNLSHVEKWVREQEFLLYRPRDFEPFSPEPSSNSDRSSVYRTESPRRSPSFEDRVSPSRKYVKPLHSVYDSSASSRDMREPFLNHRTMYQEFPMSSERIRERESYALSDRDSQKDRVSLARVNSLSASQERTSLDNGLKRHRHERNRERNGPGESQRCFPSQKHADFSRLNNNHRATDSHSWDRKYGSQHYVNHTGSLHGVSEHMGPRDIPDVANVPPRSRNLPSRTAHGLEVNKPTNSVSGEVVLRHENTCLREQRAENRKLKALSWPKFTVTSTVVPTAKKVKVTPVGSISSVVCADGSMGNGDNQDQKEALDSKDTLTPEETAYLQRYILRDDTDNIPQVNGSDMNSRSSRRAYEVIGKPLQPELAERSLQLCDETANLSRISNNQDVKACDIKQSLVGGIEGLVPKGNLSVNAADSLKCSRPSLQRQSVVKTSQSTHSPRSTGESSFKPGTPSEPQPSEFRESAGYKRASGGLKDLIRLHEQEIARVSGTDSPRKPPVPPRTSKDSVGHRHTSIGIGVREKSESEQTVDGRWKRHTTIGIVNVNNVSLEDTDVIDSAHDQNGRSTSSVTGANVGYNSVPEGKNKSTGNAPKNDGRLPPPLPPKPKYFTNYSETAWQEPPVDSQSESLVVRRSRPTEEEAIHELEKVTRTLESFQSLSIERVEEGCQTDSKIFSEDEVFVITSDFKKLLGEKQEQVDREVAEREELERKLNEQKKVANAYQKLEDRYRRRVHELQRVLMACTCGANAVTEKNKRNYSINNTFPRHGKPGMRPQNVDKAAAKVDGILQELECWLNTQQTSKTNSSSEELSAIHLQSRSMDSLRGSFSDVRLARDNPPFEILDEIDATCV